VAIVCRNVSREGQGLLVLIDITMKSDGVNAMLKTSWKICSQAMKHKHISDQMHHHRIR